MSHSVKNNNILLHGGSAMKTLVEIWLITYYYPLPPGVEPTTSKDRKEMSQLTSPRILWIRIPLTDRFFYPWGQIKPTCKQHYDEEAVSLKNTVFTESGTMTSLSIPTVVEILCIGNTGLAIWSQTSIV